MKILILNGSLRAASTNAHLARAAQQLLPSTVTSTIYDSLHDLPRYNEDHDQTDAEPTRARHLRTALAEADALIIVTPEYNGSLPGTIQDVIDWGSRPHGQGVLVGKPALVLAASAAPRAGQWARELAVRSLTVAGAAPLEQTFGIGSSYSAFVDGSLIDPEHQKSLRSVVAQFLEHATTKIEPGVPASS